MTQHCETEKHKIKHYSLLTDAKVKSKMCACGKTFELRSSLFNHKKNCKVMMAATSQEEETTAPNPKEPFVYEDEDEDATMSLTLVDKEDKRANLTKDILDKLDKFDKFEKPEKMDENDELLGLKTVVKMLLNDRNTVLDKNYEIMLKQQEANQQLIKTIQEMTPKIGNGNIITTNNTQFNLNVFLNNECKDAIKLSDFAKTLKITLQDLEFTKTNGIVEGVSSIIMNNLKGMDVHKRPIHCTDLKRETMYIKTDEWIKDEDNSYVKKFIYMASCYQTRTIQEWMDAHPGWETKEKMHVEYQTICKELYKNIECDDNAHKKIIKAFAKEVHIPRTGLQ
jgi:hypothetical protein